MAPLKKLLIVEDEPNLGTTLSERLKNEGYEICWVTSVSAALIEVAKEKSGFSLGLVDVGLPDGNGFDLVSRLKPLPVIFLTAQGTPEDRLRGFELGAEDYIVKPFHFRELILRISKVNERIEILNQRPQAGPVQIGQALVNFSTFELVRGIETFQLSHKECALLKLLYDKNGQVVSRDEILDRIWSESEYPTPRTVDNFVVRLRKWLEPNLNEPTILKSVRGVGYQLVR